MSDPEIPLKIRLKAKKVCDILIRYYGKAVSSRKLPPLDELVMTILSQHTSDVNMFRSFGFLKERYLTWEEVLEAPQDELALVIKSSGMYNLKAKRIQATLREIHTRVGKLDLTLLETMELDEAKKWLTSLHGVGPKTAAIVLLFSFERPVLPVDTHVWRVTKRLGLIEQRVSREKAHVLLEQIMPSSCIPSLNKNLVRHGREVCRAQNPKCDDCFLSHLCQYYSSLK
ncbi:MAG: endonuclease III [Candidatus Thorarchaeota archaeon]|jgi:endonuclease-3|nr:MAG: endonuclease III [Candidatus Thorarchaeota archaeon]